MGGWYGESKRHSVALKKGWKKRVYRWTEEDTQLLKSLYPDTENKKIAQQLGRKEGAIKQKGSRLGLRKNKRFLSHIYRKKNSGQFKKGNKPWNTGLTKQTDPRIKKHFSQQRRGKDNPAYKTMINNNPAKKAEVRLKISKALRGRKLKEEWKKKIFAKRHKMLKGLQKRPTKPEKLLIKIIRKFELPLRYVGNGEFMLGKLCPDFVGTNKKNKVIEVFGRAFHDPDKTFREKIPWHQQYWGRIVYYAQFGFDCLILWDNEIFDRPQREIANKITLFMAN